MKNNNNSFIGNIDQINFDKIYIKVSGSRFPKRSYFIFENKIYKTPYPGLFLKAIINDESYLLRLESQKLILNENDKYYIYLTRLEGKIDSDYNVNILKGFDNSSLALAKVYLFSNDELDLIKINSQDKVSKINDLGLIKDSTQKFTLGLDFFSKNNLILGDLGYGKADFIFLIYQKLVKNYLDKIKSDKKFIFFDYKDLYFNHMRSDSIFQSHVDQKMIFIDLINLGQKDNFNFFPEDSLTINDFYLLAKLKNDNEKKFLQDFYEWNQNIFKDKYLEQLFFNLYYDPKVLKHLQTTFESLYQKVKIKIKQGNLTKKQKWLNYVILNTKILLEHLSFQDNIIYLNTAIFKKNTHFKRSLFNFSIFKNLSDKIELNTDNWKILSDFIFLENKKRKIDFINALEEEIAKDFEDKIHIYAGVFLLKNPDYPYPVIEANIKNFVSSWNNIKNLFYKKEESTSKQNWDNGVIFVLNLKSFSLNQKNVITTILSKKFYEKYKLITSDKKMLNFIIDDGQKLIADNIGNDTYYHLLKNTFFNKLISQGQENNVHFNFIANNFIGLNSELLLYFKNFLLFHQDNKFDFDFIEQNFNYFQKTSEVNLTTLEFGEFIGFGANFIRTLHVKANLSNQTGEFDEKTVNIKNNLLDEF